MTWHIHLKLTQRRIEINSIMIKPKFEINPKIKPNLSFPSSSLSPLPQPNYHRKNKGNLF